MLRALDQLGVAFAVIAFVLSLTPSLLPRSWVVQGWISAVSVAAGYASGALLAWIVRRLHGRMAGPRVRRRVWYGIGAASAVLIPVALWLGGTSQHDVRAAVHMPEQDSYAYAGIVAIAVAGFLVVLGAARALRTLGRVLTIRARRFLPPAARWVVAAALVAGVVTSVVTGGLSRGIVALCDAAYAAIDAGTDPGVLQPASPLRSGSAASLVPWSSLGVRGRSFVSGGPTVAAIARLTGRPAIVPIRVYAGTSSARSMSDEAGLVLAELKRTRAFDRALLAIGTPPGEGGLDEALTTPLEYMYGGDTAIAAMQYSHLPSWVSFVLDEQRARESSRTLFDRVYAYWSTLPPAHRPRVVVFGMSLGALGAADTFSSLADLTARTSGALFVGPPSDTMLWQHLTAERDAGTPEILPVYRDGGTVRFAASPADLRAGDGSLRTPRTVFLQHATDPVVWWSPALIWSVPGWLAEAHGPGVTGAVRWIPGVTFCQLVGDLQVGANPPPRYGHHYAPAEVVTAWAAILHPPGWTAASTAALIAQG